MPKTFAGSLAAMAMIAAPIAATPAFAAPTNPAASLSVAKSVRASAPTDGKSKLAGGGLLAALIAAGVVAIGVVAIVNDGDSDSN
ncbi:hypothetical protein [Sphingomonas sp. CLY1604]|uniref:hypothetical protein n=1 Tax=Sphingomonas sp. CLY1604 TaxID=3457786 RepID=UPI003FD77800